jgi:hypothetical protein
MRHAVPAIYSGREFVEAGGLMSYGSSFIDLFRQTGIYVGRVLKGEKPADLPVMRATRRVRHQQSARILGIDVPATLLAIADKVILKSFRTCLDWTDEGRRPSKASMTVGGEPAVWACDRMSC